MKPLSAALLLCLALATPAYAEKGVLEGVIKGFECGDNCYLTVTSSAGEEVTGLCVAAECGPWNDVTQIPEEMIGKAVSITTGTGQQVDGSGNVMGEMISFEAIHLQVSQAQAFSPLLPPRPSPPS